MLVSGRGVIRDSRRFLWIIKAAFNMARAIATNFEREVANILWKASIPGTSSRFSTGLWHSCLTRMQDVGDAFLFRDLKTCNGLRTAAAALARPLELADVDVQVIPVSS